MITVVSELVAGPNLGERQVHLDAVEDVGKVALANPEPIDRIGKRKVAACHWASACCAREPPAHCIQLRTTYCEIFPAAVRRSRRGCLLLTHRENGGAVLSRDGRNTGRHAVVRHAVGDLIAFMAERIEGVDGVSLPSGKAEEGEVEVACVAARYVRARTIRTR